MIIFNFPTDCYDSRIILSKHSFCAFNNFILIKHSTRIKVICTYDQCNMSQSIVCFLLAGVHYTENLMLFPQSQKRETVYQIGV